MHSDLTSKSGRNSDAARQPTLPGANWPKGIYGFLKPQAPQSTASSLVPTAELLHQGPNPEATEPSQSSHMQHASLVDAVPLTTGLAWAAPNSISPVSTTAMQTAERLTADMDAVAKVAAKRRAVKCSLQMNSMRLQSGLLKA